MSRCVPGLVLGHSVTLTRTNGKSREQTPLGQMSQSISSLLSSREQGFVDVTTDLCCHENKLLLIVQQKSSIEIPSPFYRGISIYTLQGLKRIS